jgi:hypothetical protein
VLVLVVVLEVGEQEVRQRQTRWTGSNYHY